MEASIRIVLETWRKNKHGLHAVKLRVTHKRTPKYFSIKDYIQDNDWNFCDSKEELNRRLNASKGKNKDIRLNYEAILEHAKELINEIPQFTFEKFEEKFLTKPSNWDYFHCAIEDYIQFLKNEDRIGSASKFQTTLTSIKYFCEKKPFPKGVQSKDHDAFRKYKKLQFIDITPTWLRRFETYLKQEGKSTSTIGIHARNIRVLFNKAIKEHKLKVEYPFNEYSPKTASNNKRALSIEQINAIASYLAIEGSTEQFAKDMFIFSFLANGMNLTDIYRLRKNNLSNDEISFVRFKTKNKTKETRVTVAITQALRKIIKRYENIAINKDALLFPFLNGINDEATKHRIITQKTKVINTNLKKIAKQIGFDSDLVKNISMYYARHSYATISKNSGLSPAFIMESLGHSSLTTTEKYLSSFGKDARAKASEELANQISIA